MRKHSLLAVGILMILMGPRGWSAGTEAGPAEISLFAPGVISTPETVEYYPTFTPDGGRLWFARAGAFSLEARKTIFTSSRDGEGWTKPEPAAFSGTWSDTDPFVSPDGQSLFFSSNRPAEGKVEGDFDLWVVPLADGSPGAPRHLGAAVNSVTPEHSPVVTRDGTLYFRSSRPGGLGQGDLYRSRLRDGIYAEPENLGPPVNSEHGEWNCLVHPDGDFIIFEASGRPTNISMPGDLYISFPEEDGWREPAPLAALNTSSSDLAARLSPDGTWLYFSSNRPGGDNVEIYRVLLERVISGLGPGR